MSSHDRKRSTRRRDPDASAPTDRPERRIDCDEAPPKLAREESARVRDHDEVRVPRKSVHARKYDC
ncbi:MAG: hypothetical protein ACR2OG_11355 [Gemmatimonadaceae bacterium]